MRPPAGVDTVVTVKWKGAVLLGVLVAACGGGGSTTESKSSITAAAVRSCLERTLDPSRWSELPVSSQGAAVYGIDFGPNSVQIYIERNAIAVTAERASIRVAEDSAGNPDAPRAVLRSRENVLLAWAAEPSADQRSAVEGCAGFS